MTERPLRVALLGTYLRELIRDVSAQGGIARVQGNPIEVAAVALISGTQAVVKTMASDIRTLAGVAKDHAETTGKPMLKSMVGIVASQGAEQLFDEVRKMIFGGKR